MTEPDYSGLESSLIREGDLFLIGVQSGGKHGPTYIPLECVGRFETKYVYDPIAEGQIPGPLAASPSTDGITNNTFQTPLQLGSSKVVAKPTDIFDLTYYPGWLYQMFLGIDPPWLRVFLQQPFRTDQRSLPLVYFTPNYPQEGFWDGFESPPWRISPKTQMVVVPGLSIALGYENGQPLETFPMLTFHIDAMNVAVVTDADLAWMMLQDTVPGKRTRILTVGGLQNMNWNPAAYYGVSGFPLTTGKGLAADKAAVQAGLGQVGTPTVGARPV